MQLRVTQQLPQTGRRVRNPSHSWNIEHRPFVIHPFMIAPVLPGETMKEAALQVRAVTDPIVEPLMGWWLEHYLFYCPFSTLPHASVYEALMLSNTATMSGVSTTANPSHYFKTGYNHVDECLQAVTKAWFRDEGDAWNVSGSTVTQGSDTLPIAQINTRTWMDSVRDVTTLPTTGAVVDETAGPYDNIDDRFLTWQRLNALGYVTATYDDWLKMNGISNPDAPVAPIPELIRYSRDWTYPTNTVDPLTGNPSSACSWAVQVKADKDRFFKEPGFVLGVTVARPKIYISRQYSHAASMMDNILDWLPRAIQDPAAGVKTVTKQLGALGSGVADATSPSQNYVVDLRDLLIYGDQYVATVLSGAPKNRLALPTASMQKKYAATADIDAFFTGSTAATRRVRQDGICSLRVLGWQADTTR